MSHADVAGPLIHAAMIIAIKDVLNILSAVHEEWEGTSFFGCAKMCGSGGSHDKMADLLTRYVLGPASSHAVLLELSKEFKLGDTWYNEVIARVGLHWKEVLHADSH